MSDYGLDTLQLRARIVRPVLQQIGLWSIAAENLVMGTAMTESRCTYLQQIRGPAIGIFQMEPATYEDCRHNFLAFNPELRRKIDEFAIGVADADEMIGNLYFATAMCRAQYRRFKESLPPAKDSLGLAQYHKRYFNTELGKTRVEESIVHFQRAVMESGS